MIVFPTDFFDVQSPSFVALTLITKGQSFKNVLRRYTNETGTNMNNEQIRYMFIHVNHCVTYMCTHIVHGTDDYIPVYCYMYSHYMYQL